MWCLVVLSTLAETRTFHSSERDLIKAPILLINPLQQQYKLSSIGPRETASPYIYSFSVHHQQGGGWIPSPINIIARLLLSDIIPSKSCDENAYIMSFQCPCIHTDTESLCMPIIKNTLWLIEVTTFIHIANDA